MEMYEFQTVHQPVFLHIVDGLEQFRRIQSEFRLVAAAHLPFAGTRRSEFDADAHIRLYAKAARHFGYGLELVDFLHHQIDPPAHLLGEQRELYVVGVLVAVADYERVFGYVSGEHGVEFRFRSCFETDIEFVAVAHYFLHHRPHLVNLYGIDAIVLRLVVVLFRRHGETVRNFLDAVIENIGKPQKHGRLHVLYLKLVHHVAKIH